jgi:hypothetical protein
MHLRRKDIAYDTFRIQALKAWVSNGTARHIGKTAVSELADYRKIHGHCNVPKRYSETSSWFFGSETKGPIQVAPEGKTSPMTTFESRN